LQTPHFPVSARCATGIRFFRPHDLQVRITGIATSGPRICLWDVTVSRKVVRTSEVVRVSLTRSGDWCNHPVGIIIHSHDELWRWDLSRRERCGLRLPSVRLPARGKHRYGQRRRNRMGDHEMFLSCPLRTRTLVIILRLSKEFAAFWSNGSPQWTVVFHALCRQQNAFVSGKR
jgi:hypothetical protein